MPKIRVLRDQPYSALVLSLAEGNPELKEILDREARSELRPGTIVDGVRIDSEGKEFWYLPKDWYEVIE
jgi:predicted nucleotidyltransferase